jgi:cyclopropane-fatty-acyl-phospholipid synthase
MADQHDMDYTYTLIDKVFRASIGETGDFSGAMYDGDFSISLEQAQKRKHEFIVQHLNIKPGDRVLDMGCGWGPFLRSLQERGVQGIGLTLSVGQAEACRNHGFDVRVMDCRNATPEQLGVFDAIVSLGAFEHFCSREEWQAGRQDQIYRSFFKTVHDLLRPSSRFYLQTMTFGKNMIAYEDVNIHAARDSNAYILAVMENQFPGSWLPAGPEQVASDAQPFFTPIYKSSGRLDYIETIKQWGRRYREFNLRKYLLYLSLVPAYITNAEFRRRLSHDQVRANILCFERELFDHYRFVFERCD